MMGTSHVTTGAIAGLLTLPLLPTHTLALSVGWVAAVAGCALLPDLDHHCSTATRMWGPLTAALNRPIELVSQGHRWGTHDAVLAPIGFAALAWAGCQHLAGATLVYALAVGLALQGLGTALLGRFGAPANLLISAAAGYTLAAHATYPHLPELLAAAAALGVLAHIAGDAITPEGVPFPIIWIRTRARVAIPLFSTDKPLERWVAAPALSAAMLWLCWTQADIGGWAPLTRALEHTWAQVTS